jgi:hypothetical protein
VQSQALNLAELAAAEQQQTVQGIHQALIALSELPAIKAKDAEGCNAYLAKIKQRYPGFISFIVVDINGSSFCDVTDDHKPSTAAGRTLLADVLRTGAFTVGEFAIGRQTGRNVLHMIFNSSTIGLAVLYLYIAPSPNPLLLMWDVIMPRIETNRIEYAG